MDLKGTLEGRFWQGSKSQPYKIYFRVHLGVHEGPGGSPGSYHGTEISKKLLPIVQMG